MRTRLIHFVRQVSLVLLSLALCSCANGPSRVNLHVSPDFEQKVATITNVVILADFCIVRDAIGKPDYVCLAESKIAASIAAAAAQQCLTQKQYQVSATLTPFAGAFMDATNSCEVAEKVDAPSLKLAPPFYTDADVERDRDY